MKPLYGLLVALLIGGAQQAQARYETCYQQEYKCHTEYQQQCNYEPVCHTVPGRQECHQQQVCNSVPSRPNCQTVTECGRAADGRQICKQRTKCDGQSVPSQQCHYEQRCSQGYPQNECHNEQRCQSVPREQCGYESVAHQCYVPDPAPVQPAPTPVYPDPTPSPVYPDPQPQPQPHPQPQPPVVDPTPGDQGDIPAEIGPATVTEVKLKIFEDESAAVVFNDMGQSPDYQTQYFLTVRDEAGNIVIQDKALPNGKAAQKILLSDKLSLHEDHTLKLKVIRVSVETGEPFSFVKTFFRPGPH